MPSTHIQLPSGHRIEKNGPVFIIAEAGVNHNGSMDLARQLIDVAASSGVDAVKFQTFQAEKLVTRNARQASYQTENTGKSESQFDMLKRLELSFDHFRELKAYTEEKGLVFISTPFDEEAIDFLDSIEVELFKAGSGDLTNIPYLKRMAAKGRPTIISTGMALPKEVEEAVSSILSQGLEDLVVLQCTSSYPCPPEAVNLRAMHELEELTACLIGYSDHTAGILAPTAAAAMGATVIEKHFTLDRALPGPDHKASLEPEELTEMVKQVRLVTTMRGDGKKRREPIEEDVAKVARKSVVTTRAIAAGVLITPEMLTTMRPGTGLPPKYLDLLVGRTTSRHLEAHQPVIPEDIRGDLSA
ncbi:MAG: N-acetylneuraminate synthase [Bacteroidota bacterium]